MLSKEMVEKFRGLWKARFGEEISYEKAYEEGVKLLRLMQIIYKPLPKKDK